MWEAFKDFIFWCISGCHSIFGDWGMAILIVTFIFRLLLFPLMQKQIKSTYQMQKVQPLVQEVQARYADDPQRQQEEMQKIYAEAKFNPIAGCLPIFLQMPIFIALFQVLQEMGTRTGSSNYSFYNIIPDLTLSPATAFDQGIVVFIPYLILLIIFAGATFRPMILTQLNSPDSSQKKTTLLMSGFMTLFMIYIGWGSPGGVLLFWGVSSLFGVAQQQITTHLMKSKDEAKEAELEEIKPVKVDVTRKTKKKRPSKKR